MNGKTALTAALLAMGGLPSAVPPARAQAPSLAPAPRALELSRDERAALAALQAVAAGGDRMGQDAALAAARAAARGPDARYAVAHYQFQIGRARSDNQMQAQAVDSMVDSGLARPDELPALLAYQAGRAYLANDAQRTDRLLTRLIELQPNNSVALADYAQFTASQLASARAANAGAVRGRAIALFLRAFAADRAAGRISPEAWHLRALALAYDGTRPPPGGNDTAFAPPAIALARALVAAYPTATNWRDAVLVYRELVADPSLDLDARRLLRASRALSGERDYMEMAEALAQARLIGEAKAVIDEGVSRNMVETARVPPALAGRIAARAVAADRAALPGLRSRAQAAAGTAAQARAAADNYFAFGQYAEAAELYRLAAQKGGEDPNLVNLRLGAALALAGRRAEAEPVLRAVTGPRADLAGFWLAWLARRPA